MINYIRVSSPDQLEERMIAAARRIKAFWNWDKDLMVYWEPWKDPRTRSQNNLYWMWMREMADYYSTGEKTYDEVNMHNLMQWLFLGCEDLEIGDTTIPSQLVSTTTLKKDEMSEYMHKIEQWNTEKGLLLTIPAMNEYAKYREAAR